MEKQNISNHIRFYAPHHFIFYPVILLLIISAVYYTITDSENRVVFSFITAVLILVCWLSYMTRQHYALTNQNRTVRLEMRLRYFQLTGTPFDQVENQLSFSQLSALRFASDPELVALIERTLEEDLDSKTIKKSIQNWQPDHMRV
ncbi:hypothetical protein B0I27_104196 [Arcticibacter pallidicorallinus]|uniref:Uncharacterized protein n=1 Tax=Arcticibacter pallidicorallinus TaxID=1259464 RepID=A0A2T0U5I7_9SPHI|nr:DUF6526 family protein [Arcticibacter pallidicorallinus]PRY53186.1 hypothetical protein B0I27_104196 [Arcticibacter pallidicorallinus]